MTDTPEGQGHIEGRDGERVYVEPSCVDAGGVFLAITTESMWLTEKEAKKLRKLIKEARKVGLADG